MKRSLIVGWVLLIASCVSIHAQSIWTSAGAKFGLVKGLSAFVEGEYRSSDKFEGTERWTASAGLDYKLCRYVKFSGQYSFIYRHVDERITGKGNIVSGYWQPRQRFALAVTGTYRIARFTFSLRERYQFTHHKSMFVHKFDGDNGKPKDDEFIEGKDKQVLRSRIKVDYSVRKSGFTPFFSVELYNDLRRFTYEKTRISVGTEYSFNKHNAIEVYYRYINYKEVEDNSRHVIGLGYQYKF